MSQPHSDPHFVGSTPDPLQAGPVDWEEYRQLCEALDNTVTPVLSAAATALATKRFKIIKLDAWQATAGLVVRHRHLDIDGRLHFQIHPSLQQPDSSERVFWMFSLRRDGGQEVSVSGRLGDLQETGVIEDIVNQFVLRCAASAEA